MFTLFLSVKSLWIRHIVIICTHAVVKRCQITKFTLKYSACRNIFKNIEKKDVSSVKTST